MTAVYTSTRQYYMLDDLAETSTQAKRVRPRFPALSGGESACRNRRASLRLSQYRLPNKPRTKVVTHDIYAARLLMIRTSWDLLLWM